MAACQERLPEFQSMAEEMGVPLAEEKSKGPAIRLMFLGIKLDTVQGSSSLSQDKLTALKALIEDMIGRKKCTLKQIQVILGHLNFTCRVVPPGRAFCARLAWATAGVTTQHHFVQVSRGI